MLKKISLIHFYTFLGLLSVLISFALFSWTLVYGQFFSDDFTWLWHGKKIGLDIVKIFTYKMSSFYSPVLNTFYTVFYFLFGYKIWTYFLAGLMVHTLVSFLSGVFAFQLTKNKIAAIISCIFLSIAGTAYEPIVWVGANLHSFATLFILGSLVFYLKFLQHNSVASAILSCAFLILSFLTKEISSVAPLLLFLILLLQIIQKKQIQKNLKHLIYGIVVSSAWIFYLIKEFFWQKNSLTVSHGSWQISLTQLSRLPNIIIDMVFPLKKVLQAYSPVLILISCSLLLLLLLLMFRKKILVYFAFAFTIIAIMPTIFFSTQNWYDPLSSRYTYFPRVGIALLLAFIYFFIQKKSKILRIFYFVIFSLLILNLNIFWIQNVKKHYPFVYQTGKSLKNSIQQIDPNKISQVYILPNRPFENNPAHIVGAFDTIANIKEEQLYFIDQKEQAELNSNEAILFWDKISKQYKIIFYK